MYIYIYIYKSKRQFNPKKLNINVIKKKIRYNKI